MAHGYLLFFRRGRLLIASFLAIAYLLAAANKLLAVAGVWKLAVVLVPIVFAVRSLLKPRSKRRSSDELALFAGGAAAIVLFMAAWDVMGGGWSFLFGVALVLYASEALRPNSQGDVGDSPRSGGSSHT